MFKLLSPLIIPTLLLGSGGCASVPTAPVPEEAAELAACTAEEGEEMCRVRRLGSTNVGFLAEGMPIAEIIAKLGAPDEVGELWLEEATGDQVQDHIWKTKGVMVQAYLDPEKNLKVSRFTVEAPFAGKTSRGFGIGSSAAEVFAAYAAEIDPSFTEPGSKLVAGSVYGGIFFDFEDGKVISIFVGAGAE